MLNIHEKVIIDVYSIYSKLDFTDISMPLLYTQSISKPLFESISKRSSL